MIVGQPGAGKSTLARMMGDRLAVPVVHVDRIFWQENWVQRPEEARLALVAEAQAAPAWVIEGGMSATWPARLTRAEVLVVLDLPLWLRLWRVSRRTLRHYGQSRPDLPKGCRERFDPEFWSWVWETRHTGRAKMLDLAKTAGPDKRVEVLRRPRQVRRFVAGLDMRYASGHESGHAELSN